MPSLLKMHGDKDGESQVFMHQIEGRFPLTSGEHYAGVWSPRWMGPQDFGERAAEYGEKWTDVCPLYCEYGANGKCWQLTGLEGFLDYDVALRAFEAVVRHSKWGDKMVDRWRLITVNVKINQVTAREASATR